MAKTVRSVAIRYLQGQEMPTPPPMVMPSEIETVLNSMGVSPAALMPSRTNPASSRR